MDQLEQLKHENEKLSATIDKVRVAMRQRGSVVAIQEVNQIIYDHDHIDENDDLHDHIEKLSVDSVVLDKIINIVDAWNMDARRYLDLRMIEIAKILDARDDEEAAEFETVHPDTAITDSKKIHVFVRAFSPHEMTDDEINQQRIRMKPLTR